MFCRHNIGGGFGFQLSNETQLLQKKDFKQVCTFRLGYHLLESCANNLPRMKPVGALPKRRLEKEVNDERRQIQCDKNHFIKK